MNKTYIFDLDNTIYPVSAIGEVLFASLFNLLKTHQELDGRIEVIKQDIMRKPFQVVAKEHHFSPELLRAGLDRLISLRYEGKLMPFKDYAETLKLTGDKFLVTTGFQRLQWSKVHALGIADDFKKIYIVDPSTSSTTKKDIFQEIMQENGLAPENVMVIGDDPRSEINAAKALGITTVLYEQEVKSPDADVDFRIANFAELLTL